MHKKLKKYIEHYESIEDATSYELLPNGGMILLINLASGNTHCQITIEKEVYTLQQSEAMLINAYVESVYIQSDEKQELMAVRFKGAGASFFYEDEMTRLMQVPDEPINIENNMLKDDLDSYLLSRLIASKLPFNIMKIIELLDEQGSDYSIDDVMSIANVPRKVLDKMFNLRTGLTFKTYASLREKMD